VHYVPADVSNAADVDTVVAEIASKHLPLAGVHTPPAFSTTGL
jgi:hypothetical protein